MSKILGPENIISVVCESLDISDITIPIRRTDLTYARFIAVMLLLRHTKLSYEEIGRVLGRDKTTIYWAEARCKELVKTNNGHFISRWSQVNEKLKTYKQQL